MTKRKKPVEETEVEEAEAAHEELPEREHPESTDPDALVAHGEAMTEPEADDE